jgi:hypothetical protein
VDKLTITCSVVSAVDIGISFDKAKFTGSEVVFKDADFTQAESVRFDDASFIWRKRQL